ncbi:MAG TPA: hypothetical protein VLS28_07425 [Candidatus Sulfomarinibacteraceae bacterium]|nr:hypothetical protein [Candidatus Sulfomarinibacteraceae bacterium]
MAKRTRYPARPNARPAGRAGPGPAARSGTAGSASRIGGLTDAELEKAAQFEAELVARERAAIADNARRRARGRGMDLGIAGDAGAPLSVRAAHEYAYVARDVRRIVRSGGLMLAILGAAWIIVNVVGVGPA